jgi:hypothetical protein
VKSRTWSLIALGVAVFAAIAGLMWAFAGRPHRHVDRSRGYSIEFSPEYVVLPEGDGANVRAFRERGVREGGGTDVINLIVNPIQGLSTAASYSALYTQPNSKELKDYVKIREGTRKIGNAEAAWVEYTHRPGSELLQAWQVVLVRGQAGYIITCQAKAYDFETARRDFEATVDTFRFVE